MVMGNSHIFGGLGIKNKGFRKRTSAFLFTRCAHFLTGVRIVPELGLWLKNYVQFVAVRVSCAEK